MNSMNSMILGGYRVATVTITRKTFRILNTYNQPTLLIPFDSNLNNYGTGYVVPYSGVKFYLKINRKRSKFLEDQYNFVGVDNKCN